MNKFTGTTQKCTACDKTVYLVDKLEANKRIYHKACFRCHHCNGTLKLSNFNSFDGVVYCRHHFDQLFKRTGSLEKSFEGTPKFKLERTVSYEPNASKLANFFEGTRDKCVGCSKIVYPIERQPAAFHKSGSNTKVSVRGSWGRMLIIEGLGIHSRRQFRRLVRMPYVMFLATKQ
ncbi:LIM domain protein PLIM1b [Artemisia annua]|uniref:LIM domain protein PLIM1b n=1 Tax=Artemisia annua TaxID=35608 RepID=A0A2U1NMX8_ARTAN|nr:LIM domain protein PLIM1b [Artemisia annua]